MHELSLCQALVETALEALGDACFDAVASFETVEGLVVEIGDLAGVEAEALAFCFPIVTQGTRLEGALLHIQRVPVRVRCACCGAEAELPQPLRLRCPRCGEAAVDIRAGREIQLRSVILRVPEEPDVPAATAHPPRGSDDSPGEETYEQHAHSGSTA